MHDHLKTSRYDEASSMLIALLILVGLTVSLLLFFWLTFTLFPTTTALSVQFGDGGEGDSMDEGFMLDQPMADQLGIDIDVEEPGYENTIAAMADAISSQLAILDSPALTGDSQMGRGGSTGTGRGTGGGGRKWEIRFDPGNTVETYARQLDFFGIEMAVPERGDLLVYVSKFSKTPVLRRGKPADEKRSYLTWTKSGLRDADIELFRRSGVDASGGKLILKFLSPETEQALLRLETVHAATRSSPVRSTTFGIKTKGNGYEFFVLQQN